MKLAAVINWPDLGGWIWDYLPEADKRHETELIFASQNHEAYITGRGRLPAYIVELYYLARRRPDWDEYDVVFAWELRTIMAVALLRRFTRQKRAKFVALQPILKGSVLKMLPLVRLALSEADCIVNFSTVECDAISEMLRLPRAKFKFLPMAWPENYPVTDNGGGFILAYGRSNRDYSLLLDAARGTTLPVTILAGDLNWAKLLDVPPNVTLKSNLNSAEVALLLKESTLWVIPLKPAGYSSGQSVLLEGMARGKAVIVTNASTIRDYVRDGETAILVPPSDVSALREAMLELWTDERRRVRIGTCAAAAVREDFSYARFAQSLVSLAKELTCFEPHVSSNDDCKPAGKKRR